MRKWSLVGCVLAAGLLLYAGRSWGLAGKKDDRPVLRTRVALVNVTHVVKNYTKYKTYQAEMKETVRQFEEKDKQYQKQMQALAKEMQDETTPADRRKEIEKKLKKVQRQLEDNRMAAKEAMNKRTDGQMKTLYKDLEEAATRYARAHDFDAVFHYNDAETRDDLYSSQNIARKLQAGALMPLYMAPGMDITEDLLTVLNESAKPAQEEAEPKDKEKEKDGGR